MVSGLLSEGRPPERPGERVGALIHGLVDHDQPLRTLDDAEVFVLVHAVGGVLRALLDDPGALAPGRREGLEEALVQRVLGYYQGAARNK